jgi:transaldolase
MASLSSLRIRIYADGADRAGIFRLHALPFIHGLTTNPTLMRKAGVADYEAFARDILRVVTDKPVSFEVLADDFPEMRRQALKVSSWGANGESSVPLIGDLTRAGVKVNVTAILTLAQVRAVAAALQPDVPAVVSIFAGRIADTGVDPMPIMREARAVLTPLPRAELLWASVREVLNILQADATGCDIVTVTHDILAKAQTMLGQDLSDLSLDTVRMFARDAREAGFQL